jgi:hypothetical protein
VADELETAARDLPVADDRRAATADLAARLRRLAADIEAEADWALPPAYASLRHGDLS